MSIQQNGVVSKMNTKKLLLIVGLGLLALGISNKLSWIKVSPSDTVVDVMDLEQPSDSAVKKEADEVVKVFHEVGSSSKEDARKLRDLYLDLSKLISLDAQDLVIKNTEEIRQANSVAGAMFRLDMKNKYPNLAKEAQDVVVLLVGNDQVNLSPELRQKAVEAFNTLAWACNEGSK